VGDAGNSLLQFPIVPRVTTILTNVDSEREHISTPVLTNAEGNNENNLQKKRKMKENVETINNY
jgi:hypothetical protein